MEEADPSGIPRKQYIRLDGEAVYITRSRVRPGDSWEAGIRREADRVEAGNRQEEGQVAFS